MIMWGLTGNASSNAYKAAPAILHIGSGSANKTANLTNIFQNSTPEVWPDQETPKYDMAQGLFAVGAAQKANTSGESAKVHAPGWNVRKAFEGPVTTISVSAVGANVANGESVLLSNGGANAYVILTTNSSGNIVSGAVGVPSGANSTWGVFPVGRFVNTSVISYTFTREKHMMNVVVTTPGANTTNVYSNSDTIVASNGFVNAIGNVTTTSSGNLASITLTNPGLFGNAAANNTVVFTILAANGATSNGTGGVLTANLGTSTGGTIAANLGGRAGRVQYECLVEAGAILSGNTPLLPS